MKDIFKILFFMIVALSIPVNVGAYSNETTHPALTALTVEHYNYLNPDNKISNKEKNWIIQGSKNEDLVPRFFNHFYDPVRNISWNYDHFGKKGKGFSKIISETLFYNKQPLKAVDWVNNYLEQERLSSYGGNRSWDVGLDYFLEGDREESFKTLGHILHVLQDMAVPSHTRNDPHPPLGEIGDVFIEESGSPYETYTKNINLENIDIFNIIDDLINEDITIPNFRSIEDYIESLAVYSNRYFFSKDTIYDKNYSHPKIHKNDNNFGYGIDDQGNEFVLARVDTTLNRQKEIVDVYSIMRGSDYEMIFEDYFYLLSKKSILYGSGVIELFFDSIENRREFLKSNPYSKLDLGFLNRLQKDFSFIGELEGVKNKTSNFFGSIGSSVDDVFDDLTSLIKETFSFSNDFDSDYVVDLSSEEELEENSNLNSDLVKNEEGINCSFNSYEEKLNGSVIINEVAWMGDGDNFSNEWIEIKNMSNDFVSLRGYRLIGQRDQIDIIFPDVEVAPQGFILLKRGEGLVSEVNPDIYYSGSLRNLDEGLRFFNSDCYLIDQVIADPDWPAGDNENKATMERSGDLSWHTSSEIEGTPRRENSQGLIDTDPVVKTDRNTLNKGETIIESGKGFSPNSRVELHFIIPSGVNVIDYINTDSKGVFRKVYTMPDSALYGSYKYYAVDLKTNKRSNSIFYEVVEQGIKEEERQADLENSLEEGNQKNNNKNSDSHDNLNNSEKNEITFCDFDNSNRPSHSPIIINEVAWMGTEESSSDEWIEIKNVSNNQVDLEEFQLIDKDGDIQIHFENNNVIKPNNYFLLERTDDASVPGISAGFIYKGSLRNLDEGLRLLKNDCSLVDEVFADPDWPAGDNENKATMERQPNLRWKTSILTDGTPGYDNTLGLNDSEESNDLENDDTESKGGNIEDEDNGVDTIKEELDLVISEVMPGLGTNMSDFEFVEIYNSSDEIIDLSGYSLLRNLKNSTSTEYLVDSFVNVSVNPKGFFLVGSEEYNKATSTNVKSLDYIYSSDSRLAYSDNSIILKDSSGKVVDEVKYDSISRGFSIERYSYENGNCYVPNGDYLFKGNGCPDSVFYELENPNPQNKLSMTEPREAPQSSSIFKAAYNGDLAVNFSWSPYFDHNGNSSGLVYKIIDNNSNDVIFEGTDVGSSYTLEEVGRKYNFSFRAFDKDGMPSKISTSTIEAPSFFNSVNFYKDNNSSTSIKYLIDASYDEYPFIPDIYRNNQNNTWKSVLFYFNSNPRDHAPEVINNWNIEGDNLIKFFYKKCSGSFSHDYLLFPDSPDNCGRTGGGNKPKSISYSHYGLSELNDFSFELSSSTEDVVFTEDDYVVPVFYSFYNSGGGNTSLKRVAYDSNKYHFQEKNVTHHSPVLNDFHIDFDVDSSTITLSWDPADDEDTLDNFIDYEVNVSLENDSDSSSWENIGSVNSFKESVVPGDKLIISLRAKDDNGNVSNIVSKNWDYPSVEFFISQTTENDLSDKWGKSVNNISNPGNASFQSFKPSKNFAFDTVILKIKHDEGSDHSNIRLSVFGSLDDGSPDFSNLISESILKNVINLKEKDESIFKFSNPIEVFSDKKYWLMLDVASSGYNGKVGLFRNSWRNSTINGGSGYSEGEAGIGGGRGANNKEFCASECVFEGNYSSGSSDWYFKIGLSI